MTDKHDDDDRRDYEVGYRKPPKHSRFKKGESGNEKGRPKKSKDLDTLVQQELDAIITIKEGGRERRVTKREAIVMRIVNGALAGVPRQLEFLFKRAEKKPVPDPFEPTTDDENELKKALDRYMAQQWSAGNVEEGD